MIMPPETPSMAPAFPAAGSAEAAEAVALLRTLPLFFSLRPEELALLAAACRTVTFVPGETVVRQDEVGDCVYVILDGRVEVRARSKGHGAVSEAVVCWLVAGDTVGELSLFDGRPRSATCVALVQTTCLRLDRDVFLDTARRNWSLTLGLFGVLSDRIRQADSLLAEQARDPLTGVNNRRSLIEMYEREASRTQRAARQSVGGDQAVNELALVFVDVDKFKAINDTYGHHVGDDVLRNVAATLVTAGRSTDFVARYGGDEFVMLLPDAGRAGADLVVSRIREAVNTSPPGPVPFSVSVGAALIDPQRPETFVEVMARADAEMYRDKARTR
jgi:diguanylate cyclase (GGDEF)-like protein